MARCWERSHAWSDLHLAYEASGNPRTKARESWLASHPRYHELAEQIDQYQADVLSLYRVVEDGLAKSVLPSIAHAPS